MNSFTHPLKEIAMTIDISVSGDRVCMAGAGLATVGLVSASLVTTIPQLLLCYSVITGLGFGLMYTLASTLSTLATMAM